MDEITVIISDYSIYNYIKEKYLYYITHDFITVNISEDEKDEESKNKCS